MAAKTDCGFIFEADSIMPFQNATNTFPYTDEQRPVPVHSSV